MSVITIDTDDPEIRWILSRMIFTTGPIAHIFQAAGQPIPHKAEEEQVAVFIWMIQKYQEHGKDWKERGDEELRALRDSVKITTSEGLLWQGGKVIPLPAADEIARRHGHQSAEAFVRALEAEAQKGTDEKQES